MSLTDEQKALRRTGIGGSEIAAVLGESRFAAPFDVWLAKTQGWEQAETEDMLRGQFLEDGIGRWYLQRFGLTPSDIDFANETVRHSINPVAMCTPDMGVLAGPTSSRLVSIKCPRRKSDEWGEPGTDHVPPGYLLQLQWEHLVCSSRFDVHDEMHLAALLDGDLCVYVVQADRELQAWMLDYATQWWARHVVGGEEPSLEGSSQAKAWLRKRFADEGAKRLATPREVRLMVELELAEVDADRAKSLMEDLKNSLRLSMGSTQRIEAPNGVATWKADRNGVRSFKTRWTTTKEK